MNYRFISLVIKGKDEREPHTYSELDIELELKTNGKDCENALESILPPNSNP